MILRSNSPHTSEGSPNRLCSGSWDKLLHHRSLDRTNGGLVFKMGGGIVKGFIGVMSTYIYIYTHIHMLHIYIYIEVEISERCAGLT